MPTVTTEAEIFGRLAENLRVAAEDCAVLAWHPKRGHVYSRFVQSLKLVEGCCRQIYYWRDYDARWLVLKRLCAFAHTRAGNWLRNSPTKAMRDKAQPEFKHLAEALKNMHADVERLRTMATGKMGPILPETLPGPHRETRPLQVMTPGGIILPPFWRDENIRRTQAN